MESRTIALVDGTLWFLRVGAAMLLLTGGMSHQTTGTSPDQILVSNTTTTDMEIQLVKKLSDRKSRRSTQRNPSESRQNLLVVNAS